MIHSIRPNNPVQVIKSTLITPVHVNTLTHTVEVKLLVPSLTGLTPCALKALCLWPQRHRPDPDPPESAPQMDVVAAPGQQEAPCRGTAGAGYGR